MTKTNPSKPGISQERASLQEENTSYLQHFQPKLHGQRIQLEKTVTY